MEGWGAVERIAGETVRRERRWTSAGETPAQEGAPRIHGELLMRFDVSEVLFRAG